MSSCYSDMTYFFYIYKHKLYHLEFIHFILTQQTIKPEKKCNKEKGCISILWPRKRIRASIYYLLNCEYVYMYVCVGILYILTKNDNIFHTRKMT